MTRTVLAAALAAVTWAGTALAGDSNCKEGTGGSGEAVMEAPPQPAPAAAVTPAPTERHGYEVKRGAAQMRGVMVTLGGGVEGYTGALNSQLRAGPAWSVAANIRPTRVLGVELGYTGATTNAKNGDLTSGADIVRNGGHAVATFGLAATPIQPYVLAGVGVSRYNVRGGDNTRFKDDTAGNVPLGAGLRAHVGSFTADARFHYNVLFDENFVVAGTEKRDFAGINTVNGGSYLGTLNLGTTF